MHEIHEFCDFKVPVFHFPDDKSSAHDGGYDLCFDCGWRYISYCMDMNAMSLTIGNTADEDISMLAPGTEKHTEYVQTEALIPICICGTDLLKTDSRVYGEMSGGVICDNCRIGCQGDDIVYHCPKAQKADEHKDGFDLCEKCAMKQVYFTFCER